jgi:hypothetical protein
MSARNVDTNAVLSLRVQFTQHLTLPVQARKASQGSAGIAPLIDNVYIIWSASHSGSFISEERPPGTYSIRQSVGAQSWSGNLRRRENMSWNCWVSKSGTPDHSMRCGTEHTTDCTLLLWYAAHYSVASCSSTEHTTHCTLLLWYAAHYTLYPPAVVQSTLQPVPSCSSTGHTTDCSLQLSYRYSEDGIPTSDAESRSSSS